MYFLKTKFESFSFEKMKFKNKFHFELTVGVKLLPSVVSGGFLGQVKPRGVENFGFALELPPPPPPVVSGEFLGQEKPRGGK